MAKFVPDVKTKRWIVISPVRWDRPVKQIEEKKVKLCPFCPDNESLTPPEIARVGEGGENKPGWKIRVVPNKYPVTDIHEVIIHSPDHQKDIGDLDLSQVKLLLGIYRVRFQTHLSNGQVMIFCNHGKHAGASLDHPHSQLVVIPRQINLDALVQEPVLNMVEDNTFFVTYCPDFSQWPYEVWIAPKKNGKMFADVTDEEISDLADILKRALKKLKMKHSQSGIGKFQDGQTHFAYNFYIHHAKNWFIRIIPRLVHRAGFELGTGLSVNVVDPTEAARELKEIKI